MKQTRLVLALIVTSLAATPALAASMTMLQFGSFETRAEAEKRLGEISSKYKDTLGTLPTTIREVKLPPDNLTVYRTQAGPVADRSAAQSICSKLASTGDECYIVQTAMVGNVPAAAVAAAAPAPAAVEASNTTPDLTSKLSTLQESRDPLNRAALNSVSTPTLAADEQAPANSPALNAALDKAVTDQNAVANDVTTSTAAAQPASSGGFWSHLNPFSSSPKPVVVAKTPDTAAPVETVAAEALPAPTVTETVVTPAPTPIVITPVAPVSNTVATSSPAAGFDNSPVIAQAPAMQLPPPPAPLKAQDRTTLSTNKAPLAAPEPVAVPIRSMPVAGTVQVEEARRVPVTSTTTMPAQQGVSAVPVAVPFQAPVSLQPSSTEGIKTLWAQMGPFSSNDDALAFWANYRQNHPDFPVVRVRVTSSYQQLVHGVNNYWLRVGPMAQKAFVSNLCASVNAPAAQGQPQPPQIKCGLVSDLGISSPLQPTPGMLPASRYGARH